MGFANIKIDLWHREYHNIHFINVLRDPWEVYFTYPWTEFHDYRFGIRIFNNNII